MTEETRTYIDGLRQLADYLESAPDEICKEAWNNPLHFIVFTWNEDDFREKSQLLGGLREKLLEGSYANTRRRFGPHYIEVTVARDKVCEEVQVGTRVVPAQEAVPEHEEPVYEWHCEGFTVNA